MDVIYRDFLEKDIQDLAFLNCELGYLMDETEMKIIMSRIKSKENMKTIVAEGEGKIIGYIGASLSCAWEHTNLILRIQALVVQSQYRKLGIGKKLLSLAEEWGRSQSASVIALNSGNREERNSAHQFYPKIGFEAVSTGYRKKI